MISQGNLHEIYPTAKYKTGISKFILNNIKPIKREEI